MSDQKTGSRDMGHFLPDTFLFYILSIYMVFLYHWAVLDTLFCVYFIAKKE